MLEALSGQTETSQEAQVSRSIASFLLLNPGNLVKLWGCHPMWITTKYHIGIAQWKESVQFCTALQLAMFITMNFVCSL